MNNILYEDNHIIAINKKGGELVQGDATGDISLDIQLKDYIKKKYNKPGNVFLGVAHRIDRPTSGVVLFAKTSKALARINNLFKEKEITKTYWAIVKGTPENTEYRLENHLLRNEKQNKSYVVDKDRKGAKLAIMHYTQIAVSDNYSLLEIKLETGRHHQIRAQLSHIRLPIKGDLKYGFHRSNPDGSISLHAREIEFIHPVKKEQIKITAPVPEEKLWLFFEQAPKC